MSRRPYQPPLLANAIPQRAPREVPADELLARRILAELWPFVQPIVGRAITQMAWKQRNKAVALDMARAGNSVDDVMAAWREACSRIRGGVYSLRIVQDQLLRRHVADAPQPTSARDDLPTVTDDFLEELR